MITPTTTTLPTAIPIVCGMVDEAALVLVGDVVALVLAVDVAVVVGTSARCK